MRDLLSWDICVLLICGYWLSIRGSWLWKKKERPEWMIWSINSSWVSSPSPLSHMAWSVRNIIVQPSMPPKTLFCSFLTPGGQCSNTVPPYGTFCQKKCVLLCSDWDCLWWLLSYNLKGGMQPLLLPLLTHHQALVVSRNQGNKQLCL